jgi:hypothetical protein
MGAASATAKRQIRACVSGEEVTRGEQQCTRLLDGGGGGGRAHGSSVLESRAYIVWDPRPHLLPPPPRKSLVIRRIR